MNAIVHDYSKLYCMNLNLFADGSCSRKSCWEFKRRVVTNKVATYIPDEDWDAIQCLYHETEDVSFVSGAKLFVASECKISRDTFRTSGYTITRDKNKADVIVIPDVLRQNYYSYICNFAAKKEGNLYLINVNKCGWDSPVFDDSDVYFIRKYLTDNGFELDETQKSRIMVWFLPKCEEINEVLTGNVLPTVYIQESLVPVTPSTTISPETLTFWENVNDNNLLARTICTSDWMKYPITLLCFLVFFKGDVNWCRFSVGDAKSSINNFRRILDRIGYQYNYYKSWVFSDRYISPEDYEMLQSFLYAKLGVADKGGFIDVEKFNCIPIELQSILQRRVALAPLALSGWTLCDNVKQMALK